MLTSVMPEGLAIFIECVVVGVCIVLMYAILAILLIYMERKICGFFQCRLGPMRVGPYGTIQVICDVLKMLTKEIFTPKTVDKFLYNLAPYMVLLASFLTFACLPMNKGMGLQRRHILRNGRFQHRRGRYPVGRLELEQQVLPDRSHA